VLSKYQRVVPFYLGTYRQPRPIATIIAARRSLLMLAPGLLAALASADALATPTDGKVLYAPIVPKAMPSTLIDIKQLGSRIVAVGECGHVLYFFAPTLAPG
jgi:hypothetical protein